MPDEIKIGKFDISATYAYAKALLDGAPADEAKQRGIVAAIMGAKAKLGHTGGSQKDHQADKTLAEKKKKTTITAESFDHQVADKMGEFFDKNFLPAIKGKKPGHSAYRTGNKREISRIDNCTRKVCGWDNRRYTLFPIFMHSPVIRPVFESTVTFAPRRSVSARRPR
jgi:hypothetical protein